jgi:hypothetical protein
VDIFPRLKACINNTVSGTPGALPSFVLISCHQRILKRQTHEIFNFLVAIKNCTLYGAGDGFYV